MQFDSWRRRGVIAALFSMAVAGGSRAAASPVILVVGDSLSAEYGLKRGTGWVALLQQRLAAGNIPARVVNASISGDTTSGGRSRLGALLRQHQPTHVVIELGANDALRGLPLDGTRDNLAQMVRASQKAGAKVLVVGMQVPPNYGNDYTKRFGALFPQVAREYGTGLVPFLLQGVADAPDARALFQADGIHPRQEAQARMLDNVWPELKKLLAGAEPPRAGAAAAAGRAKAVAAPRS